MTPEELFHLAEDLADEIAAFDLTDAMLASRGIVLQQVEREFSLEQDPFGNPWQPWYWTSQYPIQEHKTLQFSGVLMASFITQQAGHVEEITPNSMTFGSSILYAGIHQEGASFRLGIWLFGRRGGVLRPGSQITIPARPIVGWPTETVESCEAMIVASFVDRWESSDA